MKVWKENGNTTTLLHSLKELLILQKERRGQVNTIVMEHFTSIVFHKSGPPNKQHTYQSILINVLSQSPKYLNYICPDVMDSRFSEWITESILREGVQVRSQVKKEFPSVITISDHLELGRRTCLVRSAAATN